MTYIIVVISFVAQILLSMVHVETVFPFQVIFNLSLFALLLLPNLKENKLSECIVFVSKSSYGIYLSHAVVISALCMLKFEMLLPLNIEPLMMAFSVFCIECLGMIVVYKMNLDKWLR